MDLSDVALTLKVAPGRGERVEVALVAITDLALDRRRGVGRSGVSECRWCITGFATVVLIREVNREGVVGRAFGDDDVQRAGVLIRQQQRQVGIRSRGHSLPEEALAVEFQREICAPIRVARCGRLQGEIRSRFEIHRVVVGLVLTSEHSGHALSGLDRECALTGRPGVTALARIILDLRVPP